MMPRPNVPSWFAKLHAMCVASIQPTSRSAKGSPCAGASWLQQAFPPEAVAKNRRLVMIARPSGESAAASPNVGPARMTCGSENVVCLPPCASATLTSFTIAKLDQAGFRTFPGRTSGRRMMVPCAPHERTGCRSSSLGLFGPVLVEFPYQVTTYRESRRWARVPKLSFPRTRPSRGGQVRR